MKSNDLTRLAILTSCALMIGIFERSLSFLSPIPGVKLGLANLVIVMVLYLYGIREAFMVNCVRVMIGAIFGGGPTAFIYSLSGAMVSLLAMWWVKRLFKSRLSVIGVSVTGAYFHGVAQVLVAMILVSHAAMIAYLPVVLWSGLLAGFLIGILANQLIKKDVMVNASANS